MTVNRVEASDTEASILARVSHWENELEQWRTRIERHTRRVTTRDRVFEYLTQLLANVERRNSWQLAEAAGQIRPYAFQHVLGRARWSTAGVRDEVRAQAYQTLRDADDVRVVDETGFLKQGRRSAGVKRQYSGTAGRIENCQIGVFLTYTSRYGHALTAVPLIDRELYLPQEWCDDPARCQDAGIPDDCVFQTKPQLAKAMLTRAFDAGICPRWVTGDAVYGSNRHFRQFLEARRQPHGLAVSGQESVWIDFEQYRVKTIISDHAPPPETWHRLAAGTGTKGQRLADWTCLVTNAPWGEDWARGLLLRRATDNPADITAYAVFAPSDTPLADRVAAAGTRWTVERCFVEAKDQVGLDEYEVRSWIGWYRHMTLVMAAHVFLTMLQAREQKKRRRPGQVWACSH